MVLLAPVAFADRAVARSARSELLDESGASASDGERLPADAPSIWLHAVSLGEVRPQRRRWCVRCARAIPRCPFVLTTATPTGRARAQALFGTDVDVRFLPYDTPGSVRRFLTRIRPRVAIIMETELWPNLLHECRRRGVPVVFASARLDARNRCRDIAVSASLFSAAVAATTLVAAQSAGGCGALHRPRRRPALARTWSAT